MISTAKTGAVVNIDNISPRRARLEGKDRDTGVLHPALSDLATGRFVNFLLHKNADGQSDLRSALPVSVSSWKGLLYLFLTRIRIDA